MSVLEQLKCYSFPDTIPMSDESRQLLVSNKVYCMELLDNKIFKIVVANKTCQIITPNNKVIAEVKLDNHGNLDTNIDSIEYKIPLMSIVNNVGDRFFFTIMEKYCLLAAVAENRFRIYFGLTQDGKIIPVDLRDKLCEGIGIEPVPIFYSGFFKNMKLIQDAQPRSSMMDRSREINEYLIVVDPPLKSDDKWVIVSSRQASDQEVDEQKMRQSKSIFDESISHNFENFSAPRSILEFLLSKDQLWNEKDRKKTFTKYKKEFIDRTITKILNETSIECVVRTSNIIGTQRANVVIGLWAGDKDLIKQLKEKVIIKFRQALNIA